MEALIDNYGRLIDRIRKDRNLSRLELCEDITSLRNFQRFTHGEISISNDKIIKLVDRLGLDYFTFYQIYKSKVGDDYSKLKEAFNLSTQWKYQEATIALAKVNKDAIDSEYNMQMYKVTESLIKKGRKFLADEVIYHDIEKAIDFPAILMKKTINVVELNALFSLNSKYTAKKDRRIIDYFLKCIEDDTLSFSFTGEMMSSVYASIAKGLYTIEDYNSCIACCVKGIEYCRSSQRLVGFSNLLGYKALAYNKIGKTQEANDSAMMLYMELIIENNDEKTIAFTNIIQNNLDIMFSDLIEIKKRNV